MSPLSNAVLATFLLLVPVTWSGPLLAQTNDTTASSPGTGDAAASGMTLSRIKELYFEAAREGRDDLLGGLLKSGVLQPDARNPQGYTALILAAYNEHPGTVDFLIGKGADACATDPKGNSSLMGVAFKGDAEIATRLIAAHCDVNAVNVSGQTPLMMAAL
jgi:ankyrin repeat protein